MKTFKFTTIILLMLITAACSNDDNSLESKPESFRVKAVSLTARLFPASEGNALELYGRISFTKTVNGNTEERILWQRNRDYYESIGTVPFLINSEGSEQIFTLTEEELQNDAKLSFYAQMYDQDPTGDTDDYLGNELKSQFANFFANVSDLDNPVQFDFVRSKSFNSLI